MSDKDYEQRHLETLDRDLGRLAGLNHPTTYLAHPLMSIGISFVFIFLAGSIAMFFFENTANVLIVGVAAGLGAYMALNIGANDVANNMGPAVGANALTMGGAIAIAAIFESAGALVAGGDVVSTVAKGIIAPENMQTTSIFIFAMLLCISAII